MPNHPPLGQHPLPSHHHHPFRTASTSSKSASSPTSVPALPLMTLGGGVEGRLVTDADAAASSVAGGRASAICVTSLGGVVGASPASVGVVTPPILDAVPLLSPLYHHPHHQAPLPHMDPSSVSASIATVSYPNPLYVARYADAAATVTRYADAVAAPVSYVSTSPLSFDPQPPLHHQTLQQSAILQQHPSTLSHHSTLLRQQPQHPISSSPLQLPSSSSQHSLSTALARSTTLEQPHSLQPLHPQQHPMRHRQQTNI